MKISTSNSFFGTSDISVSGTIIDGDGTDLTDPDFSFKVIFGGSSGQIDVANNGSFSDYLAVHGIYTPNFGTYRAMVYDGATLVFDEVTSANSLFIPRGSSSDTWRVEFSEYIGSISVAYVAAGFSTDVPRMGIRGNQLMPYDGLNLEAAFRVNQLAQPTNVVYKNKSPRVSLRVPDSPTEWTKGDFQSILNLYKLTGVISVLDFDDDSKTASAGYDISAQVRTHPSTLLVQNVQLTYSVAQ